MYKRKEHKINVIKHPKLCSSCWVNPKKFPEAEYFFNNRHIIKEELLNVLSSNKWSRWDLAYDNLPTFTQMSHNQMQDMLQNNQEKINPEKKAWRLYGLMFNKQLLPNANTCPKTMEIIKKYPDKVLNVGFSLLEPGAETKLHKDYSNKFYRLHIPLIIPKNNNMHKQTHDTSVVNNKDLKNKLAIFQVENDKRVWIDDEYFIFDDTCMHNAWNNTDEIRIVFLVDILKD